MKITIRQALQKGLEILKNASINNAQIDAYLLIEYVLKRDKVYILTYGDKLMDEMEYMQFISCVKFRASNKPLQYITGTQEFMGLEFKVNEYTLIPRQDTEILVEKAIEWIKEYSIDTIIDIGTGTGCIPISICHYCKQVNAIAVDISKGALEIAKHNAIEHNLSSRIDFIHGDLFQSVKLRHKGEVSFIISNPPYIPTQDIRNLDSMVKDYEPTNALDGGNDGLDYYRVIIKKSTEWLCDRGFLLLEVGYNQSEAISQMLETFGYRDIVIMKDLAGINRVVGARYNKYI